MRWISFVLIALSTIGGAVPAAEEAARRDTLVEFVRQLDWRVATAPSAQSRDLPDQFPAMLANDLRKRIGLINAQDVRGWRELKSVEDWEAFKAGRIDALRRSLGQFPQPPEDLHVRVTRTIAGDGFRIECLVFESRPGLLVTANLYRPTKARGSMPGILICHSHHNPKTQNELQDMGVNWARVGCLALVMDQLGHEG